MQNVKVKIDRIREFYSEEIAPELPVLKKSDLPKIEEISNMTDVGNFTSSAGNVTNISDKNVTEAINITDIGYVKNMKGWFHFKSSIILDLPYFDPIFDPILSWIRPEIRSVSV